MVDTPVSLRQQALRGVAWSVVERWMVRAASLLVFVLLGRLLTPADFGTVAAASVFVDLVGLLLASGLSTYLVKADSIDDLETATAFWVALAIGAALAVVVLVVAPFVAPHLGGADLVPMTRWLALGLVLSALSAVPTALLQRSLAFRQLAVRSITAVVSSGLIAVVLAFSGAGAWSIVVQALVFGAVRTVSVWVGAGWLPSWQFSPPRARKMTAYSINLVGITLLNFIRNRGEELLIAILAGPTTLGIWVVAKRLVLVFVDLFAQVVTRVATPVFARSKGHSARLARGYTAAMTQSAAIAGPALMLLAALSPQAIPLIFGEQWRVSGSVATFLALGAVVASATYMDRALLLVLDRARLELGVVTVAAASHLAVAAVALWLGADLTQLALALALRQTLFWPVRLLTIRAAAGVDVGALLVSLTRIWSAAALAALTSWAVLSYVTAPWPAAFSVVASAAVGTITYPFALWVLHRPLLRELHSSVRSAAGR